MNNFPYQQMYQRPVMNNGIIWVQGIEGAKAFQLTPNSNAILMDSENDGRFYIKVSDNVGMCNLRSFSYTEITSQPNSTDYVTRKELEDAIRSLKYEQPVSTNARSANSKQSNQQSSTTTSNANG